MSLGYIHSLQSMGAVDGPGIRFCVFLQGCPLRCMYCHNPDTWLVNEKNGGRRLGTPHTVEELVKKILRYKPYFANGGGVTVTGGEPLMQAEFVEELFTNLHKYGIHTCLDTSGNYPDSIFPAYASTGTASSNMDPGALAGTVPLDTDPGALAGTVPLDTEPGASTGTVPLDTEPGASTGTVFCDTLSRVSQKIVPADAPSPVPNVPADAPSPVPNVPADAPSPVPNVPADAPSLDALLSATDLVICDIKFTTEKDYHTYTGGSLNKVLSFLDKVTQHGVPLWVRHVVVPGYTDSAEEVKAMAEIARKYPTLEKIELLPFHKLCIPKYEALGIPFRCADIPECDTETITKLIPLT